MFRLYKVRLVFKKIRKNIESEFKNQTLDPSEEEEEDEEGYEDEDRSG